MPAPVQNVAPLAPVKKAIKPAEPAPAADRPDDFKNVLKGASQKSAEPKAEAKKAAKPDTKADAKPDGKTTAAKPGPKSVKASKSKPGESKDGPADPVNETVGSAEAQTGDPAAQIPQAEVAAGAADAQPIPEEPKAKDAQDQRADAGHADQPPPTPDAVIAQAVQPIDHSTDQKPRQENTGKKDNNGTTATVTTDNQTPTPASSPAQRVTPTKSPTVAKHADVPANNPEAVAKADASPVQPTGSIQSTSPTESTPAQVSAAAPPIPTDLPVDPPTPVKDLLKTPVQKAPIVSPLDLNPDPVIAPKAQDISGVKPSTPADSDAISAAAAFSQLTDPNADATAAPDAKTTKVDDLDPATRVAPDPSVGRTFQPVSASPPKVADVPPPPPEVQFAQSNHDKIVGGVTGQLLPHGGAMQIRLDPPELGALKIMVEMRDGVMNATFETSNEHATQLLSHSLNQLKHVLESQGVSVERLQVQQAPKGEQSATKEDGQQQQKDSSEGHAARQEQQRKEMLRRMWRKVSGADDPIDYFA